MVAMKEKPINLMDGKELAWQCACKDEFSRYAYHKSKQAVGVFDDCEGLQIIAIKTNGRWSPMREVMVAQSDIAFDWIEI